MVPPQTDASRPARQPELLPFFLANVLFGAGLFAHAFLYNFYLAGLGAKEGVMGNAAAALTAGGLAALAPAGVVVNRFGAVAAYLAAAALAGAGLAAGAFVESIPAVYAAAFVAGMGTTTWRVSMGPLLMGITTPESRPRAFSWNVGLLVGSGAVWTAAAGFIPGWVERATGMEGVGGIRAALVAGAAGTLLSAALLLALRRRFRYGAPDRAPDVARDEKLAASAGLAGSLRALAIPPRLAALVGLVAAWMLASALVLPFFNLYFRREHDLPLDTIGVLFAAVQAVTAVAIFASGEGAARMGPRRMLAAWMLVFAPALWALGGADALGLAVALYFVQGIVPPATNPLIDQLLLERAPAGRQGTVSSWRNAATDGAGLVGASVGGVLLERGSFGLLFGIAGAIALAAALLLIAALRAGRSETMVEAAAREEPAVA